jgi:DNA end-binding protein Ku
MARKKSRPAGRGGSKKTKPSARPLWKGSINFGLVAIPVALYPAEAPGRVDLDLLDRRDFAPVRYRRVNEKTGEEVPWDQVVKGYKHEGGEYVALSEDEIRAAQAEATQSIDIVDFVDAADIPPIYFDRPYYLEPLKNGRRAYALLREALARTAKVGIAKMVIRTRQHLAALMPQGPLLVVNLLRFPHELRDAGALDIPEGSLKQLNIGENEVKMAERLVETMVDKWRPEKYHDDTHERLLQLIDRKIKAGKTKSVEEPEPRPRRQEKVLDIMHLLKRSVEEARKKDEPQRRRKAG